MNQLFKKFITLTTLALSASLSIHAGDSIDYRPQIHGTVRTRFEVATEPAITAFRYATPDCRSTAK